MANYNKFSGRNISILNLFSMTSILIFINVIAFVLFTILTLTGVIPFDYIALKPANIVQGKALWTFITSMFMHAGFTHLFFNMISLFFIGTFVEKIIGRKRYTWFYLISGLVAGLFFVFLAYFFGNSVLGAKIFGSPDISGVGASGAIFGLLGLLAVLIPNKKVYLIAGPLIAIIIQAILSTLYPLSPFLGIVSSLITVYIFVSIFTMFSFNENTRKISLPLEMPFWLLPIIAIIPLVIIGLFVPLPIGNTAHLGGLLTGIFYGIYLKNKYKRKTQYLNRHFN